MNAARRSAAATSPTRATRTCPGLERVGFPIAEIEADGRCTIGKADGTGGLVTESTVKEQLLYEVHDPAAYLTPDVIADIGEAQVAAQGADRVPLTGVRGHARPSHYKVNVCHEGGWLAEGEISYAGARAEARARLAADVLRSRLPGLALRVDLIGALSVFDDDAGHALAATPDSGMRDVRLRVAATHADRAEAERLGREVMALYTCGPAGGGGVRSTLTPRLNTLSCLLAREAVPVRFEMVSAMNCITVPLYRAAHGRTGDKGDRSNISVIAWHTDLFALLVEQVTPEAVAAQFRHRSSKLRAALCAAPAAGDELRA